MNTDPIPTGTRVRLMVGSYANDTHVALCDDTAVVERYTPNIGCYLLRLDRPRSNRGYVLYEAHEFDVIEAQS